MIEQVLVIVVLVVGVWMRRVATKNGPVRFAGNTSVILAVAKPDPGSATALHDVQVFLDIDKQAVDSGESTLD
jgi:hypothetical protein